MDRYYYLDGTQEYGPVPLQDLISLCQIGRVGPTTKIRAADSSEWQPALEVAALTATLGQPRWPAPVPGPAAAPSREPSGLGGWLTIFTIAYVIGIGGYALLLGIVLFGLLSPDYAIRDRTQLVTWVWYHLAAFVLWLAQFILFINRSDRWPAATISLWIVGVVLYFFVLEPLGVLDAMSNRGSDDHMITFIAVAAGVMQTLYVLTSRRVRSTFIRDYSLGDLARSLLNPILAPILGLVLLSPFGVVGMLMGAGGGLALGLALRKRAVGQAQSEESA